MTRVGLPERAAACWHDGWQLVAGGYNVEAAHSLIDQRLTATVQID